MPLSLFVFLTQPEVELLLFGLQQKPVESSKLNGFMKEHADSMQIQGLERKMLNILTQFILKNSILINWNSHVTKMFGTNFRTLPARADKLASEILL